MFASPRIIQRRCVFFRLENDFYLGPPTLLSAHDFFFLFSGSTPRITTRVRFERVIIIFFSIFFFSIQIRVYRMSSLIKFGIAVDCLAKSRAAEFFMPSSGRTRQSSRFRCPPRPFRYNDDNNSNRRIDNRA